MFAAFCFAFFYPEFFGEVLHKSSKANTCHLFYDESDGWYDT
ncbi:hypothetical protein CHCC14821_3144 [Bacillus paralicheniformis]|nr:hypothetical protein CHCC14821_3144 [Bacillus paralicheniformis]TWM65786.1 hypothetical protein CHCC14814_0368 [Bacillus paralicheniformis]